MIKNGVLAQSYNMAIDAGFSNYLEQHASYENSEIKVDEEKLIAEVEYKWLNTKLPELDNETPMEYINSISTLNGLMGLFINMASVSDVGVPCILVEKLKEYGEQAAVELFDFVKAWLDNKDPEKVLAAAQAVYAMGCLRYPEYKQKLIELLFECFQDDLVSEAVCAAIAEYDVEILDDLIKTFDEAQQPEVQEHLLTCVAEIAREKQTDKVFYFLKDAFRVISNLKLAVEILGDYGDGRAIPFLRGYILKNNEQMDKATFNHMRAVIKKLGGEIDDLVLHT